MSGVETADALKHALHALFASIAQHKGAYLPSRKASELPLTNDIVDALLINAQECVAQKAKFDSVVKTAAINATYYKSLAAVGWAVAEAARAGFDVLAAFEDERLDDSIVQMRYTCFSNSLYALSVVLQTQRRVLLQDVTNGLLNGADGDDALVPLGEQVDDNDLTTPGGRRVSIEQMLDTSVHFFLYYIVQPFASILAAIVQYSLLWHYFFSNSPEFQKNYATRFAATGMYQWGQTSYVGAAAAYGYSFVFPYLHVTIPEGMEPTVDELVTIVNEEAVPQLDRELVTTVQSFEVDALREPLMALDSPFDYIPNPSRLALVGSRGYKHIRRVLNTVWNPRATKVEATLEYPYWVEVPRQFERILQSAISTLNTEELAFLTFMAAVAVTPFPWNPPLFWTMWGSRYLKRAAVAAGVVAATEVVKESLDKQEQKIEQLESALAGVQTTMEQQERRAQAFRDAIAAIQAQQPQVQLDENNRLRTPTVAESQQFVKQLEAPPRRARGASPARRRS